MKTNNIVSAPQIDNFDEIYTLWRDQFNAGRHAFYEFMTTPSPERSRFILKCKLSVKFIGGVAIQTVSIKSD